MPRSGCRLLASFAALPLALLFGASAFGEDLPKLLEKPGLKPPAQCGPRFVSPELSAVSEKTERIRRALETQVEMHFPDNTLQEVCQYISQIHDIDVILNERELKLYNRSEEDKVSFKVTNTSAKALETMLGDELDYVIEDDKLVITSSDAVHNRKETRLFGLQEFILTGMRTQDLVEAARQVADADEGVVATGNVLVVTLNQHSQEKVLNLLISLRWAVLKQTFNQTADAPKQDATKPASPDGQPK